MTIKTYIHTHTEYTVFRKLVGATEIFPKPPHSLQKELST